MKDQMKILAIESSCDETAASLVVEKNGKPKVISSIVSSQINLHKKTGGVVPEVASRAHLESIIPVIDEALKNAGVELCDLTHVAVTAGPGLVGSLMVGFDTAKSFAYGLDLPIVPVNHIEGHIYSACRGSFPLLALTVSGGHTSLTLIHDHGKYETLGETLDDAAGEAFDKVAKLLDLGYPGGPIVSQYAQAYREKMTKSKIHIANKISNNKKTKSKELKPSVCNLTFPRPMLDKPGYDFSFSGLKTAVLTEVKRRLKDKKELTLLDKREICFAFEDAAIDVLVGKAIKAAKKYKLESVLLAGGVSANTRLQNVLKKEVEEIGSKLYLPEKEMMGDNAAMIGIAAYYHIVRGDISSWDKVKIDSNMKL